MRFSLVTTVIFFVPLLGHAEPQPGLYKRGPASVELSRFGPTQLSTIITVYGKSAMCAFEGVLRRANDGRYCSYQEKECRLCVEGDGDVVRVRVVRGCQTDGGGPDLSLSADDLQRTGAGSR